MNSECEGIEAILKRIRERRANIELRQKAFFVEQENLRREQNMLEEDKRVIQGEIKSLIDLLRKQRIGCGVNQQDFVDEGIKLEKDTVVLGGVADPTQSASSLVSVDGRKKILVAGRRINVKTLLHSILEAANERGSVRLKDLAKELDVDESLVREWAEVMARRGMVRFSFSVGGDALVKKALPVE